MKDRHPLIVVLEDIRSALNVGAIFRTSDAVMAEELILTGITPYPPHPRIPKTALGSIESVPWKYIKDMKDALEYLKDIDYQICSVEIDKNAKIIYEFQFPKRTALIFGNEINGVSKDTLKRSDSIIYLPMFGIKESLNVATTVGVCAYELIRQWEYK